MTGNTVLLGIGLATGHLADAGLHALALGAFVLGAATVGTLVPRQVTVRTLVPVALAELTLLVAFAVGWSLTNAVPPTGAARQGLIAVAGAAMGLQSGVMRLLDVPVSTTYITGTWTALSASIAARPHSAKAHETNPRTLSEQALVVTTYLAAACGAAFAYHRIHAAAALLPAALLLAALTALAHHQLGRKPRTRGK